MLSLNSLGLQMEVAAAKQKVIVGLPKGRFEKYSWELIRHFTGREAGQSRRLSHKVERDGYDLVIKLLKMPDIASLLSKGKLDAGILCDEWAFEYGLETKARIKLHWCRSDIVLAGPRHDTPSISSICTVATSFPRLAKYLLQDKVAGVNFIHISGSTEAAVPEFADVIVDCVETGNTLADNDLIPLAWLTSTNVRIFLPARAHDEHVAGIAEEMERVGRRSQINDRRTHAQQEIDLIKVDLSFVS